MESENAILYKKPKISTCKANGWDFEWHTKTFGDSKSLKNPLEFVNLCYGVLSTKVFFMFAFNSDGIITTQENKPSIFSNFLLLIYSFLKPTKKGRKLQQNKKENTHDAFDT